MSTAYSKMTGSTFTLIGEAPVGRREGVEKQPPKALRLLWSQEVDDGLYADGDQGDEDKRTGYRLVARVQLAADSEDYGAQGEQCHA